MAFHKARSYSGLLRALTAMCRDKADNRALKAMQGGPMNHSGNQGNTGGNAQHGDPSTTIGVGGPTSGEAGSTPTHETQAETGGSGGSGLTRNEAGASRQGADQEATARQSSGDSAMNRSARPSGRGETAAPAADSAMNAHMRGFQDTRSEQAGPSETGLGSPETGANQDMEDLDRQRHGRDQ
jgi:hypothetical protein